MNASIRRTPDDVRKEILANAWELFRQLGARATIADVASRLGMSSANVYRFFASKQALTDAVCANQLAALIETVRTAAERPGAARDRIKAALLALHFGMREQMLHESRVQEIVDAALSEHWPAIGAFHVRCVDMVAALVAEGQSNGEFTAGDPRAIAIQILLACTAIHHPTLIAYCEKLDPPVSPDRVADFALRALNGKDAAFWSNTVAGKTAP
jgi:AcrR family transcriptional regulator